MIETVIQIAKTAGELILAVYNETTREHEIKVDGSPLTEADRVAHQYISQELSMSFPDHPQLSEEDALISWEVRKNWKEFFLIDPLDGTKEFINRNGEFTVNIALIKNYLPVLGVVHAPVLGITYHASDGNGAFLTDKNGQVRQLRVSREDRKRVVGSRSHSTPELQIFLDLIPGASLVSKGSSLKLCMVAEGSADIYPRHAPTSLWDTAAGHCIVTEAGGYVLTSDGEPLRYGSNEPILNPPFITGAQNEQEVVRTFCRSLGK